MSKETPYHAFVGALYAVVFLMIGYGIFKTPTYIPDDPRQCLTRPWLDTTHGC